jgi:hypothetical protein
VNSNQRRQKEWSLVEVTQALSSSKAQSAKVAIVMLRDQARRIVSLERELLDMEEETRNLTEGKR